MKTVKMYATYGVIAHEKQPVYTLDRPCGEIYDAYTLTAPEGWSFAESVSGDTLVESPDGTTYTGAEILTNWGDVPCFCWYDGHSDRRVMLTDYAVKI